MVMWVPLLLITGTVGVGKSSVADEVFEILKAQSKPVALINLDELGYAQPTPQDDLFNTRLRLKNLSAVWPNYRDAGVEALIIPYVVENGEGIERFRKAIPNADIFVVRLDAPQTILEERILNRPMGGNNEWHIKRASELAVTLQQSGVEDAVIDTQDKTISEVAKEVIAKWKMLAAYPDKSK